ncbi:acyl-CoA thioesterase [Aquabacterium sp. OR-4]|uniref:acyl-CoA thioesterase n=1 Tax=Aquabacterium sp. OR-4 TaxID=2978127 RepID=UPI0028C6D60B|nr:thioesterase family protein [Aquabacterium sp. OR-4]MDT7834360.1 thioesterase family protein [Aquabacterium sp. OR-4]
MTDSCFTPHPFDAAIALTPAGPQAPNDFLGATQPAWQNMVGPFGGITAAIALNAVLQHPRLLGEPVSLTVNYAGATADGPFTATARPVRTNRSTQHWIVEISQPDADGQPQVCTTATVFTALRRETFSASDMPMPAVPAPEAVARQPLPPGMVAWLQRYEMRPVSGGIPMQWEGQTHAHSQSRLWVRDAPPRALDFASLAALSDIFFPRVWLRRARRVPAGTVSMTVYFHADGAMLAGSGSGHLLAQAQAQAFHQGYFDQTGQLWNEAGQLLATTHQVVYFKE